MVEQASCLCTIGGIGILPVYNWWNRHLACVQDFPDRDVGGIGFLVEQASCL
ncbi:MAG: hypothetical protein F6K65_27130 [Moorea sp. SIO3C2]|nr:hypothetical protein [Moorena sp. SIO3C2]